jgi:hypothetical protein
MSRGKNLLANLLGFSASIGTVLSQDKYGLIFCGRENLRAFLEDLDIWHAR